MCTHLAKRGSRYYFRRKIPLDLLPHYKGREVMRSLGTSDRREAGRLTCIIGVELDGKFERLRVNHSPKSSELPDDQHSAAATPAVNATGDSGSEASLLCADIVQCHLSQRESIRNGLQEVLTGEGSTGIAGAWAARQAQQGQPKAAAALKRKTSFDVLIDKWALGVQPEPNTISRTRMHARRFEEMAGVHTVRRCRGSTQSGSSSSYSRQGKPRRTSTCT